jgi:spermidine/putrescine-binding protein
MEFVLRRRTGPLAALVGLLLLATGCTGASDKAPSVDNRFTVPSATPPASLGSSEGTLNLVAPAGYVESGATDKAANWVASFTKASGCKVTVAVAAGADAAAGLVASGRYDGVAATADVGLRLVGQHVVAPVNTALIPNYAAVVPGLKAKPWYAVNQVSYGVPQGRSATVLTWNPKIVTAAPTSWASVFTPTYRGRITARDSPDTIAEAATYLRIAHPDLDIRHPYALSKKQLDAAVDLLKTQHDLVGSNYYRDYQQAVPLFKSGKVVIGATSQALAELIRLNKTPVKTAVPTEGTTGTSTTWMLAAKAKHPNCMYRWMDHMLSAPVNARSAEWLGLAPATAEACKYTLSKTWCATFHATDETFWSKVAMQTAPLVDCRDGRGTICTNYAAWTKAWKSVVG